jgi:hypothetical protein
VHEDGADSAGLELGARESGQRRFRIVLILADEERNDGGSCNAHQVGRQDRRADVLLDVRDDQLRASPVSDERCPP